jgi:disulfide bond formation protein DsbB
MSAMTRKDLILLAASGSAALLLGAFAFQHIGGLAPCPLCIWQRWPHGAAVVLGAVGLFYPRAFVAFLGALAAGASGAIGIYHTGVERGWWEGLSNCVSGDISGLSTDELMEQIMAAPLIRCDEVAWEMWGLSMASWNAVLSFALAAAWVAAAMRRWGESG